MKIKILILMISILMLLAACSGPAEDSSAAPADTALISTDETKKETIKETTTKERVTAENSSPERQEESKLPSGIQAETIGQSTGKTEPSGEEYMTVHDDPSTENAFPGNPQTAPAPAWGSWPEQNREETSKTAEDVSQSTWQETACHHNEVYISGFVQPTCVSEGYSGDEICALCGTIIREGNPIGRSEHSWTARTVHEDAYLTCYCGRVFYSADEHDRHVNEMVSAGEPPDKHGCVWTPGTDRTVYTCSVCGAQLNN